MEKKRCGYDRLIVALLLLVSVLGTASYVFSAEIIFRPGPGLNDGTDDGSLNAGKDAYAWSCGGDYSGSSLYFGGSPRSSCNQCNNKGYVQFNLDTLPSDVEKVYLGVTHYPHTSYCYSNCEANFYFYPALESWDEMTIGSGSMPTEGNSVFGPLYISFPNDFGAQEYDITDMYRSWKTETIQNNGLVIYSPDGTCNNASVGFSVHSSDDPDVTTRPYLRVEIISFIDILPGFWAYDYIMAIDDADITSGYSDGTYRPSGNVTRAQMAVFIIKAKYGDDFSYGSTPYFTDVPSGQWAFKYIQKMYEESITTGYSDGTYRPGGNVTRGQMAAFIVRALYGESFTYNEEPYFTDVPESHGAFKYIQKVSEEGIASGYSDGTYRPSQYVNRAQMAAFIAKAFLGMP
jgi:hypothetical protein